jgi:hypothetical protein
MHKSTWPPDRRRRINQRRIQSTQGAATERLRKLTSHGVNAAFRANQRKESRVRRKSMPVILITFEYKR